MNDTTWYFGVPFVTSSKPSDVGRWSVHFWKCEKEWHEKKHAQQQKQHDRSAKGAKMLSYNILLKRYGSKATESWLTNVMIPRGANWLNKSLWDVMGYEITAFLLLLLRILLTIPLASFALQHACISSCFAYCGSWLYFHYLRSSCEFGEKARIHYSCCHHFNTSINFLVLHRWAYSKKVKCWRRNPFGLQNLMNRHRRYKYCFLIRLRFLNS